MRLFLPHVYVFVSMLSQYLRLRLCPHHIYLCLSLRHIYVCVRAKKLRVSARTYSCVHFCVSAVRVSVSMCLPCVSVCSCTMHTCVPWVVVLSRICARVHVLLRLLRSVCAYFYLVSCYACVHECVHMHVFQRLSVHI